MKRQHRLLAFAVVAAVGLSLAACGDDDDDASTGSDSNAKEGPAITVAAQDFGESKILAEIYAQALSREGFDAKTKSVSGNRQVLFGAFESGDVNLAPDYVASELNFFESGQATSDVTESLDKLKPILEDKGLEPFDPSDAVDTNVFVMLKDTADEKGIESLSDLADKGADLKLGAPQDCSENAFCIPGLKSVYGVDMSSNFTPLDPGLILSSLDGKAVDVGVLFSTDSRLTDEKYLVLEDDKSMSAADNVFPVANKDLSAAYGDALATVLNDVSAKLTTDGLLELNKSYDVDHEDADDIAKKWLDDNGF
jgi:osmoprotectant transport system substrate-binding protein